MERININKNWEFAKLPQGLESYRDAVTVVSIPHTWYADEDQYRGLTVYKKNIEIKREWKKVFIEFCGVDQICKVYINDEFAGEHKGAYGTFRVQVSEKHIENDNIELKVYVDNTANETVSPIFGDFTVFGGIYRDVNLLITEEEHFDYMYYGTDGILVRSSVVDNKGILSVEPHVCADTQDAMIEYTVIDENNQVVSSCQNKVSENVEIIVSNPMLWNGMKDVHLYKVVAKLIVNGQTVDETLKETGFRTIDMNAESGFYLNGKRLKINGVAKHQDVAERFSAIKQNDIYQDFELIKEVGANAIRLSHYQHTQETYDICDKEGYVVWAEIPMLKMTENEELLINAREQLKELVLQNVHHPSIFCWGIQNEIGMFNDHEFMHNECIKLRDIAKELDSNRLVTAANLYTVKYESELNNITDMVGYNIYFGWYYGKMEDYSNYLDGFHAARPNMPIGVSEYGVDASPFLHADHPQVKDYSEEYQALFHETVYPIFKSKEYLWGSFIWNMFDFSSSRRNEGGVKYINQKGIVTFDRKIKKDAFYYYKAQWSDELFVHICSKRFVKRAADKISIKVYTNLPEVTLVLEKVKVTRTNDGNGCVVFDNIPLVDGANEIVVKGFLEDNKEIMDTAIFERVDKPEETYVLPDSGAGTTVKNWFLDDDTLIREGYYSLEDAAYEIVKCKEALDIIRKFTPETAEALSGNTGIPMGLSMLSILNYNKEVANKVNMKEINDRLNQIKK